MASDISTLLSSGGGFNNVATNGSPILTSANSTVNQAVEKVMADFTQSQNQGTTSSFLNQGYQQLITAMGFSPNTVDQLNNQNGSSNPVINAGIAGASDVFMNIVTKKLNQSNFGPLKSLNTVQRLLRNPIPTIYENLPASLTKMHWFVVAMETLLRKNNLPSVRTFGVKNGAAIVQTRSYAQDFTQQHAPKQKFMFLMNIRFKGDFSTVFDETFTFLLKKADRPKIKIDHEPVNMYNFRTLIPKMISFDPITVELHDSIDKLTLTFFMTYMKILSPVMRSVLNGSQQNGGQSVEQSTMDASGMNFDANYLQDIHQNQAPGNPWTGSMNTPSLFSAIPETPDEEFSLIDEITIYHVYDFGLLTDVYHYVNPRITDFTLDDLDMSNGTTTNSLVFNFVYDAFNLEVGRNPLDEDVQRGLLAAVPETVKRMDFQGASKISQDGSGTPVTNTALNPSNLAQIARAQRPIEPPLPTVPTAGQVLPNPGTLTQSVVPPIQQIPANIPQADSQIANLNSSYSGTYEFVTDPVTGGLLRNTTGTGQWTSIPPGENPLLGI